MSQDLTPLEEMGSFFDKRAGEYEAHMLQDQYRHHYYRMIAAPLPATDRPLRILDLGCGSGLELKSILAKVPRARITGIDLSRELMAILRQNFTAYAEQIELVHGSYLELPFPERAYDYIISSMTMHHHLRPVKQALYRRIRAALKTGGAYIEADYMVSPAEEARLLAEYRRRARELGAAPGQLHYHLDIPVSIATQKQLFHEAGFREVRIILEQSNEAILVCQ